MHEKPLNAFFNTPLNFFKEHL